MAAKKKPTTKKPKSAPKPKDTLHAWNSGWSNGSECRTDSKSRRQKSEFDPEPIPGISGSRKNVRVTTERD